MIKKRDTFWTIIFAFVPGAGHMFNGFMKQGVSYMGLFCAGWAITAFSNIGAIGFSLPVVWFYAFFDCINKVLLDEERFYAQRDCFLFEKNMFFEGDEEQVRRNKMILGIVLIVVGVSALWNNVIIGILFDWMNLPQFIQELIYTMNHVIPEIIVASLIIWVGIRFIKDKKTDKVEENQ